MTRLLQVLIDSAFGMINYQLIQELITRSLQLPHVLVTAFTQTDLFLV